MRLSTLAPIFDRQTEEAEQDVLLLRTAEAWAKREHSYNEKQLILGLEQESLLFFLAQLIDYLERPYFQFSKACLDRFLIELQKERVDTATLHELAYCARLSATSFQFWETVVERVRTATGDELVSLARLLDSEDGWGHFSTVDIRLRVKSILEQRFLDSQDSTLELTIAECMVFDKRTHPDVVTKARTHPCQRVRDLCKLGQSMPHQLHSWWIWHFAGSNTFATGMRVRPPRWSPRLRRWLRQAVEFPRLRLFCCFLFEVMNNLSFQEEDFPVLLSCYHEAWEGKAWCLFGSRMGHWSALDWSRLLLRHHDSQPLTRLFLELEPVRWSELWQGVRHSWVDEGFPEAEEVLDFLTVVQASGAVLYDIHQGQPRWRGVVGESWPSPPAELSRFLGQDKTGVVSLSSEGDEDFVVALAHFVLGEDRGIFCFRRLYVGVSAVQSGLFGAGEIGLGKEFRDKVFVRTESSDDRF